MKIIKEGRVRGQYKRVYLGGCIYCECVVEVYEDEIETYRRGLPSVKCPTPRCGYDIYVMPKIEVEGREG